MKRMGALGLLDRIDEEERIREERRRMGKDYKRPDKPKITYENSRSNI